MRREETPSPPLLEVKELTVACQGKTVVRDICFSLKKGEILLPEGKQAFVMSQDDVCYYEYMDGDGFASRMVIGADGKPTCEMKLDDGTISTGSYDLVPLLEDFIQNIQISPTVVPELSLHLPATRES